MKCFPLVDTEQALGHSILKHMHARARGADLPIKETTTATVSYNRVASVQAPESLMNVRLRDSGAMKLPKMRHAKGPMRMRTRNV